MPLDVPYEDLQRDFKNCIVMFKNKPVHITGISREGLVRYVDLLSNKPGETNFELKHFDAPLPRLGFVNVLGSVVYLSRIPVRKYFMGLSTQNTQVKSLAGCPYPEGAAASKARIMRLDCSEIAMALLDKYPTFAEAMEKVEKGDCAYAFDRQFAVTSDLCIFYRGANVGKVRRGDRKVEEIKFNKGNEHLALLLGKQYEKTIRDFRPKKN